MNTLGTRGFFSRATRRFVGGRPKRLRPEAEDTSGEAFRAGHYLSRLDRNRKPCTKSLWYLGLGLNTGKPLLAIVSSHRIEWVGLVKEQAFIYATLSTLTLCLICARQTTPYLTLFSLKSKICMVQFVVLLLLICMNSWIPFTNCLIG